MKIGNNPYDYGDRSVPPPPPPKPTSTGQGSKPIPGPPSTPPPTSAFRGRISGPPPGPPPPSAFKSQNYQPMLQSGNGYYVDPSNTQRASRHPQTIRASARSGVDFVPIIYSQPSAPLEGVNPLDARNSMLIATEGVRLGASVAKGVAGMVKESSGDALGVLGTLGKGAFSLLKGLGLGLGLLCKGVGYLLYGVGFLLTLPFQT